MDHQEKIEYKRQVILRKAEQACENVIMTEANSREEIDYLSAAILARYAARALNLAHATLLLKDVKDGEAGKQQLAIQEKE